MLTSNFTFEWTGFEAPLATASPVANVPRAPMPAQLQRLGVPASVWTKIYDRAEGVAARAATREEAKRELDKWVANAHFNKHKDKVAAQDKVAKEKGAHDANSLKGWRIVLNECIAELAGAYGVSAKLMRLAKGDVIFGVHFRCNNVSRLQPNKLKLVYDHRTDVWSWPRDEVPPELAALHVDSAAWNAVWDLTKATYQKTLAFEGEKRAASRKLAQLIADSQYHGHIHHHKYQAALKGIAGIERSIEREREQLLEVTEDALYMWGIAARLACDNVAGAGEGKPLHSGIILRFRPTVPVIASATVALPLPSAPASVDNP